MFLDLFSSHGKRSVSSGRKGLNNLTGAILGSEFNRIAAEKHPGLPPAGLNQGKRQTIHAKQRKGLQAIWEALSHNENKCGKAAQWGILSTKCQKVWPLFWTLPIVGVYF